MTFICFRLSMENCLHNLISMATLMCFVDVDWMNLRTSRSSEHVDVVLKILHQPRHETHFEQLTFFKVKNR